jgi:hypothetical protein
MFISQGETELRQTHASAPAELELDLGVITIETTFARMPWGSARMNAASRTSTLTLSGPPSRA